MLKEEQISYKDPADPALCEIMGESPWKGHSPALRTLNVKR